MNDEIKELKRRAGIVNETSPLLMAYTKMLAQYRNIAQSQGEDMARVTLLDSGVSKEMVDLIAKETRRLG